MIKKENIIPVGKFQRTHALKGELNAILDIEPDYFEEGNPAIVEMDGIFVPFYVESVRPKGAESFLIRLDGVDSEMEAKQFVNSRIYAEREKLNEFLGEEFTTADDIEGFDVIDDELGFIGRLLHIDDSTENALFVVESPEGEEILIPVVDDFIRCIDEDSREIFTSLPEGLVSLNSDGADLHDTE